MANSAPAMTAPMIERLAPDVSRVGTDPRMGGGECREGARGPRPLLWMVLVSTDARVGGGECREDARGPRPPSWVARRRSAWVAD